MCFPQTVSVCSLRASVHDESLLSYQPPLKVTVYTLNALRHGESNEARARLNKLQSPWVVYVRGKQTRQRFAFVWYSKTLAPTADLQRLNAVSFLPPKGLASSRLLLGTGC